MLQLFETNTSISSNEDENEWSEKKIQQSFEDDVKITKYSSSSSAAAVWTMRVCIRREEYRVFPQQIKMRDDDYCDYCRIEEEEEEEEEYCMLRWISMWRHFRIELSRSV